MRGPQVPVTEQSFPCPLCPVAFVLHHMRARVIYKTFLAGGGGQYLDPQPRAVPYIDKLLHLFHWHCSFPPLPPDFNIGRMAKSPWAPQRLPTKCRTTELFRPARTEPNIKIGGMGGGTHVGRNNDAQVGRSHPIMQVPEPRGEIDIGTRENIRARVHRHRPGAGRPPNCPPRAIWARDKIVSGATRMHPRFPLRLDSPPTVPKQSPNSPQTVPNGNLHSPRAFLILRGNREALASL